jgi:glycine/D-amino acid oxidase-like deaminating enzyme
MIVIIGAGICGLAAAYELARRGQHPITFSWVRLAPPSDSGPVAR